MADQLELEVVLCSGYNEQDVVQRFAGKGLAGFAQKPFTLDGLAKIMQRLPGLRPGIPTNS